ncbi:hypothetical protein VKT23_009163 [Stygiomarasmius scandens]|uniref:L-arabinokinase n=1 Tax=Marasmiellus scandens TaxID=2682957 RepID=A0ABR1JJU2_9AGAR
MTRTPAVYVYYCSGHGYGHATRVSAFSCHLLDLDIEDEGRPTVYIVSSAPQHVFSEAMERGALYRYADWIDPVIVQPLAYRVDREKSVQVLKAFLSRKNEFAETERKWLVEIGARCVLSDAAFLGCLAAKLAGVPSVLITNFTFDSVYSYLSTSFIDDPHEFAPLESTLSSSDLPPDVPVPSSSLNPLVNQIYEGYRCADLLLRLPGHIPIPSFSSDPRTSLPSPQWVDPATNRFKPTIMDHLNQNRSETLVSSPIPLPPYTRLLKKAIQKRIIQAPLLVRPPLASPSPYSKEGRSKILSSVGVPGHLHNPNKTKILVVSFGGQVFRRPASSRRDSGAGSRDPGQAVQTVGVNGNVQHDIEKHDSGIGLGLGLGFPSTASPSSSLSNPDSLTGSANPSTITDHRQIDPDFNPPTSPRLTTDSHIWIPGAPPVNVSRPTSPRTSSIRSPRFPAAENGYVSLDAAAKVLDGISLSCISNQPESQPSPRFVVNVERSPASALEDLQLEEAQEDITEPKLLPDDSWIAIICGVSKEQWDASSSSSDLPPNFYIAPSSPPVHLPSLLAISDCLLGKLGYGSVSECIDSRTPFVYVSRPLFVEEFGLRVLLEKELGRGGVEMSREEYEGGNWAERIREAVGRGKEKREKRFEEGMVLEDDGYGHFNGEVREGKKREIGMVGIRKRRREGREMAKFLVGWVEDCWEGL